jgi:hypothetical protein
MVPRAEFDALQAKFDAFTVAADAKDKAHQQELEGIKEERRKQELTSVLSAKIEKKEELEKKVKYFMDSKTPVAVVQEAFAMVPDIKPAAQDTSTFSTPPAPLDAKTASWWARQQAYERSFIK